jgi:hypothetical protein
MNWRATWILLTAVAVVFAFIVLVDRPIRQERLRQASRFVLPDLDPATITNVEIQPWGQPAIDAERVGSSTNLWRLARPVRYPAQGTKIEAFLAAFANLQWKDRISDQELRDLPNAQETYGFTEPQFSILLKGAGQERRIEVGGLSPMADEVFLNLVGNTAICLAGAEVLKVIPQDGDQWRDLALLDSEKTPFDELTVRSGTQEKLDLRRDATNHLWYMSRPVSARADSTLVKQLLANLDHLMVARFISDDPQPDLESFGLQSSSLTPDVTLLFTNGGNLAAMLQVGVSPSNAPGFAYARRAQPSNIVLVARDPFAVWQADYTNFLDQHLVSVPPAWIESIEVHGEDEFSARKETNGLWEIRGRETFLSDATLMKDWLEGLAGIPTTIEKTTVADFSPYGLDHPSLRYTVRSGPAAGSHAEAQLSFGTNKTGEVFERRADEYFVNTIVREEFDRLPRASWQLRDRHVWNFDSSNVVSVTVRELGGVRKYMRDPDGEWTFAPGFHGPPFINSPSLEEGVHRIGKLTAVYWDGVGNDHLERFGFGQTDHSLEFEVRSPNGIETNRIEFGARSPYFHPYASVMKNGERLIFEFPADLYENFVEHDLTIPAALRYHP